MTQPTRHLVRYTRELTNREIARALRELSLFLEMDGVSWKPRAYEQAAQTVATLSRPLRELYAAGGERGLDALPHVGKGIAHRISELLRTGHCAELERLRARMPVDVLALTSVGGIGPKHALQLYRELEITSLQELEHGARAGRIRSLPHFGDKTEQRILKSLTFLRQMRGRVPLGEVLPLALAIERALRQMPGVRQAQLAGSARRRKDTLGDLDFVVATDAPDEVARSFVALPQVSNGAAGPRAKPCSMLSRSRRCAARSSEVAHCVM